MPEKRREEIVHILQNSSKPISGATLAKMFNLTRQVIVQDMAILKSLNEDIISTSSGYMLNTNTLSQRLKVKHKDEDIEDELNTIVDSGGEVLDVIVTHDKYGEIRVDLGIKSRKDVKKFMLQMKNGKNKPLNILTDNIHYHTVLARNEEDLEDIKQELYKKGYLLKS